MKLSNVEIISIWNACQVNNAEKEATHQHQQLHASWGELALYTVASNHALKGHWRQPGSWFQTKVWPAHIHVSVDSTKKNALIAQELLIKLDANSCNRWIQCCHAPSGLASFGQISHAFPNFLLSCRTTKQTGFSWDPWSALTLCWRKTASFWGPTNVGVEPTNRA